MKATINLGRAGHPQCAQRMSDHEETRSSPAFRLARAVQRFCGDSRKDQNTKSLLRKETRYKQASDNSSWFEERAGQVKALVEAGALRERERVLQAIFDAVGGVASTTWPSRQDPVVAALSQKFSAKSCCVP